MVGFRGWWIVGRHDGGRIGRVYRWAKVSSSPCCALPSPVGRFAPGWVRGGVSAAIGLAGLVALGVKESEREGHLDENERCGVAATCAVK